MLTGKIILFMALGTSLMAQDAQDKPKASLFVDCVAPNKCSGTTKWENLDQITAIVGTAHLNQVTLVAGGAVLVSVDPSGKVTVYAALLKAIADGTVKLELPSAK